MVIPLSLQLIEEAKQLREQGATWGWLARHCKTTPDILRRKIDPAFTERKRRAYKSRPFVDRLSQGLNPKPPPLLKGDPLLDRLRAGLR